MSKVIRRTPLARHDLATILEYLERSAGPDTADRFFLEATACFERLADHPGLGVRSHGKHPSLIDVRSTSMGGRFKRYVVFYRPIPRGIELVRILHGARDASSLRDAMQGDDLPEEGADA